jgi:hypothetical protein
MATDQQRSRLRFVLLIAAAGVLAIVGGINLGTGHPWLALINVAGIGVLVWLLRADISASGKREAAKPLRAPRPQAEQPKRRNRKR